jgi:hypothetical protein
MGQMYYAGSTEPIEIPDRILAHLKVVVSTKLRRSESFPLSWQRGEGPDAERSTIWLHAAIPLRFEVSQAAATNIDRGYLNELATAANSTGGIVVDISPDSAEARGPEHEAPAAKLVRVA